MITWSSSRETTKQQAQRTECHGCKGLQNIKYSQLVVETK